ncbi:hypothetical protein ACIBTV_25425 [Micromonospora sp. NPDC049366]|uniref:hypothetical protein n=1 Tax=Micromonospora sp. NPDC049366 TaxID=3364271 RepID=UPI0037B21535
MSHPLKYETLPSRLQPAPGDVVEVAAFADEHAYRLRAVDVYGHAAGALVTGQMLDQRGRVLSDLRTFPLGAGIPYAVIPDRGWKGRLRETLLGRAGRHRTKG